MRFWSLLTGLIAAVLLIAACGGGDDDDSNGDDNGGDDDSGELTENGFAESLLLTLDDFPSGDDWDYTPPDDSDEPNPLDECDKGEPANLTGKADGGDFSQGGFATIAQDVRIFEDATDLAASLDDIDELSDCVEQIVEDGGLDTEDATFSDFTFEQLDDFPETGDLTRAYRMTMHIVAIDEEGEEQEGDLYLDMVYIGIGRFGFRIVATNIDDPYPGANVVDVVELAFDKMQELLTGGEATDGADDDDDDEPEPTTTRRSETNAPDDGDDDDDEPTGAGSSQDQPVAFGDTAVLAGRAEVRILDVNFDAEEVVLEENDFNEATPGKNMVLMTIEVTNVGDEELDVFFDLFYNLIGKKGTEYSEFDPSCGVAPDEIEGVLDNGESTTGTVCVQADEDDSDLVFLLELIDDNLESSTLYFALD